MIENLGEQLFDHYQSILGEASDGQVFYQSANQPSIQILEYDKVFRGCKTFTSLGLTHYMDEVGELAEAVIVADAGWSSVPYILANALFLMVQERISIGRGTVITGMKNIDPVFYETYNKSSVYFTSPYAFPDTFATVSSGGQKCRIYLAILISQQEYEFIKSYGVDRFETLLESLNVDPFDIRRMSSV